MSLNSDLIGLAKRVRECAQELLPAINPLAKYSNGEILRMLAFRLFAHAEIEGYLEAVAQELVTEIAARHKSSKLPSVLTRHLALHMDMVGKYPPRGLSPVHTPKVGQRMTGFLAQHSDVIDSNNGVTEKDVLKLFTPLGFDLASFDRDWLQSMTALGQARGEVAHDSALLTATTATQPSPQGERARLVAPMWGLRSLTRQAEEILKML